MNGLEALGNLVKQQEAEIMRLSSKIHRLELDLAHERETFMDERGVTWNRPTAEAYQRACVALDRKREEVAEALQVRDLARAASNRDLEAKRQAERELAELRKAAGLPNNASGEPADSRGTGQGLWHVGGKAPLNVHQGGRSVREMLVDEYAFLSELLQAVGHRFDDCAICQENLRILRRDAAVQSPANLQASTDGAQGVQ